MQLMLRIDVLVEHLQRDTNKLKKEKSAQNWIALPLISALDELLEYNIIPPD